MKVSMIIPVYNLENYILHTLRSCVDQDLLEEEYEIICVNDGSSDESEKRIRDFASEHKNVRYCCQENAGVSSARNKGLDLAAGEYIWFIDGDDLIEPNCLARLYQQANEARADIVWFQMRPFEKTVDSLPEANVTFEACEDPEQIYPFMFAKGGGGVCCNLYCRKFLKANDIRFQETIQYSEDVFFHFQAVMTAKICLKTKSVFYHYRQRYGSAMHSNQQAAHIASMKKLAFAYDAMLSREPDGRKQAIIRNKRDLAVKALLFSMMCSGDIGCAKRVLRELKQVGFYPYPLKRELLVGNQSGKQWIINLISFFFPCEVYYKICVRVFALRGKKGL